MRLSEVMNANVVSIQRQDTVEHARYLMHQHGIRHLPVLTGETLVGILSESDVRLPATTGSRWDWSVMHDLSQARTKTQQQEGMAVEELMTPCPVTLPPQATVERAAALLASGYVWGHKIGCLPIVESGRLVGVLTATDLLEPLTRRSPAPGRRASIQGQLNLATHNLEDVILPNRDGP